MSAKLDRVIVPMPQFVNPNSPETNAGSINLTLDSHPVEHSGTYGGSVSEDSVGGLNMATDEVPAHIPFVLPSDLTDKPEDEWTNGDYKEALKAANLAVSGNKDELEARWADFKANNAASDGQ